MFVTCPIFDLYPPNSGPSAAQTPRLEKGRLPLDQALEYAIQIADALDKAHRQGVVHRDLKPGNIMITKSGTKLLDFGLAKLKGDARAVSPLSQMPTQDPSAPLTAEGTIIGTLQYMAPEQLEGKEADARTDIFAFGAVVYEMVTGKKAFEGKSQASLISAIMSSEPEPMAELEAMTPRSLDHVVKRCMTKLPDARWQSTMDVVHELRWVGEIESYPEVPVAYPKSGASRPWMVATAVCLLAAAALAAILLVPADNVPEYFTILPPNSTSGVQPGPIVSPNGDAVVFSALNDAGVVTLWIRSLNSESARELPDTQNAFMPFWSPDGESIGFFTDVLDARLMRTEVDGSEPPRLLAPVDEPKGAHWGEGGLILVAPVWSGPVYAIPDSGGAMEQVTFPDENVNHLHPHLLPGGHSFLFFEWDRNGEDTFALYAGSIDSREVTRIGEFKSKAEYQDGHLFYAEGDELFARRFDIERLVFEGSPRRIATQLGRSYGENSQAAFSVEGDIVALANGYFQPETQWLEVDRQGRRLSTIGNPGYIESLEISPNQSAALFTAWNPADGATNVYLMNLATGDSQGVTFGDWYVGWGRWSPDGEQIVYWDDGLYRTQIGQREQELLLDNSGPAFDWSSDGRFLITMRGLDVLGSGLDLGLYDMNTGAETHYATEVYTQLSARIAPSPLWVAYASDEDGEFAVNIDSFPEAGSKTRVGLGELPMWRADGRELYFVSPNNQLMAATVDIVGSQTEVSTPLALFEAPPLLENATPQYAVLDNGERFIFNAVYEGAEPRSITVVRNWKALLADQ